MKKKILIHVTGTGEDGCAFYRGMGPWSVLGKEFSSEVEVSFFGGPAAPWGDMRMADALFLMRPYTKSELQMVRRAKQVGIPVWIDVDDLLLELTPDNPAKVIYEDPEHVKHMVEMFGSADVVTVTTQALHDEMTKFNKNCFIVPNAMDPYFNKVLRRPKARSEGKIPIVYRGSITHQRDLAFANWSLEALEEMYPELLTWFFVGLEPWSTKKFKSYTYVPPRGVFEYLEIIGALTADIGIVPLVDTPFNRCKSNIAAMEIALTGAVPIVPRWPEWENIPGAFLYSNETEFMNAIVSAIECKNEGFIDDRNKKVLGHFYDYTLWDANLQRLQILRSI